MTQYNATLQFEIGEEEGLLEVSVEAKSVHVDPDWITLNSGVSATAQTVVAAFPRDRVVSIVKAEED